MKKLIVKNVKKIVIQLLLISALKMKDNLSLYLRNHFILLKLILKIVKIKGMFVQRYVNLIIAKIIFLQNALNVN